MKKYCSNCGKKLEGNGACDCRSEATITELFKASLNSIVNMIKKPSDTLKTFVDEKNYSVGLVNILIYALLNNILFLVVLNKIYNYSATIYGYQYMNSFYNSNLEYALIIFIGSFLAIILFTLGLYFIISKLLKKETSLKKIFTLVAGACSFNIFAVLLGIILVGFSLKLLFITLFCGTVLFLLYIFEGLKYIADLENNSKGYVVLVTVLISLFLTYILSYIFMW